MAEPRRLPDERAHGADVLEDPAPHEADVARRADADAPVDGEREEGPRRSPSRLPTSPVARQRLLAAAAISGFLLAATFAFLWADLRAAEADREAVREHAEITAARITTFTGTEMDEWVGSAQALATPQFAGDIANLFDLELRQALAAREVQSVGQILQSFVQSLEGDRASALVLVRQTYTAAGLAQPVEDELQMEIELRRVDGEWRTHDAAILGPSGLGTIPEVEQ